MVTLLFDDATLFVMSYQVDYSAYPGSFLGMGLYIGNEMWVQSAYPLSELAQHGSSAAGAFQLTSVFVSLTGNLKGKFAPLAYGIGPLAFTVVEYAEKFGVGLNRSESVFDPVDIVWGLAGSAVAIGTSLAIKNFTRTHENIENLLE